MEKNATFTKEPFTLIKTERTEFRTCGHIVQERTATVWNELCLYPKRVSC